MKKYCRNGGLEMTSYFKKNLSKVILVFVLSLFITVLAGCNGDVVEEEEKYTVIYDGNGGFLGNKSSTVRKLQVSENSKIPKYLQEYTQDPYVVSSLGLATRQGYLLRGWYQEEDATFAENVNGEYVYLDLELGNGAYVLDEEGDYVFGYVPDEDGDLIFVSVEELPEDAVSAETEYIYFEGGNGYGFYLYDSEDAEHVAVYEDPQQGFYLHSTLTAYNTYLIFDELTDQQKTLFVDLQKYSQEFYEYTEEDAGLNRYSLESNYVFYDNLFELSASGDYVYFEGDYVLYDSDNSEHDDLDRYQLDNRYVFTPSTEVPTPSDLTKYKAEIAYWDFENHRITEDVTLIADWVKKLTVYYDFVQSDQIAEITTKPTPDNTSSTNLVAGETIGRYETIPNIAGYTFVGWSKSETEYDPWDFKTDVFPEGVSELYLYAYMIEGTYTRITSRSGLSAVANNPEGNYVLVNDIDLGGLVYENSSPLGFRVSSNVGAEPKVFTGEFLSFGNKITNFTLSVKNSQKALTANAGIVVVSALFPYVQDATISGVIVEDMTVLINTKPTTATDVICDIGAAGIVGTALSGATGTIISNVDVDIVFTQATADTVDCPVYVGDVAAIGTEYITITNSTATIDYSAITGITVDPADLIVETIN
jgi:hypothetical protein